jgi:hypothetical protein
MDPFFNAVRADQVENRIDRYKSHDDLPKNEQTVQTYFLLADYPKNITNQKEPTTDEFLYIQSKRRKLLSLEFYRLLVEASPECPIHRDMLPKDRASKINCLLCSPNNRDLFTKDLDKDIKTPNPCKSPQAETVKAKEIIIETETGEKKYMYTKNKDGTVDFYEYKDELKGYLPVTRDNENYSLLIESV